MKVDIQYQDVLNAGDSLKICYPDGQDSEIEVQKVEIRKIEIRHPRSGDSYLDLELHEIG